MTIDKDPEVRLFGFRINRTGSIILSYLSLTLYVQFIPQLYYNGVMIFYYFINYTIPELLARFGELIQGTLVFTIILVLIGLLITIFILCANMQKSFRGEGFNLNWIYFKLTKAAIPVLFTLSLVYLIINSYQIYISTSTIIFYILREIGIVEFIIMHFIYLVGAIILLVINIYTLIVCAKNREIIV